MRQGVLMDAAAFKLPGQRSCQRGYAEDWLGRGDAKEKALEARQHHEFLVDHGLHRCARNCGRCRCSGRRMASGAGLDKELSSCIRSPSYHRQIHMRAT